MSHQIKRKVEGADRRDHADRAAHPESKIAFARGNRIQRKSLTVQALGFLGGNRKRADGAIHFSAGKLESFTRFSGNRFRQILGTFTQQRGSFEKYLGALVGRHIGHDLCGTLSSGNRRIHICATRGRQGGNGLAVILILYFHQRAGSDPLSINEKFVFHLYNSPEDFRCYPRVQQISPHLYLHQVQAERTETTESLLIFLLPL